MAELDTSGGGKHKKGGKKRGKKMSTKVDMTPMVDLGFLLITFFILTTTFNKPQAMEINMPVKDAPPDVITKVKESCTMTLVLGEGNKIYWWMGINNPYDAAVKVPEVTVTDYSDEGIRKTLMEKGKEVRLDRECSEGGLVVLIKAMDKSTYKNMVDILDEMKITDSRKYALVDIIPEDLALVKDK